MFVSTTRGATDLTGEVLERARTARGTADRAEAEVLLAAVAWAEAHPADSIDDAATLLGFGEGALAIGGVGAPLVAEFCIAELAAALHLPTAAGKQLVGDALELKHRLPKTWRRVVVTGDLQAWRARRIAQATSHLSLEAAGFVDAQVAKYAHRIGPGETARLVDEAIARYMPEAAEQARRDASDTRHVSVGTTTQSFTGTTWIAGEIDLTDALDLDARLARDAATLAEAGCSDPLDVRRAIALGDLARGETPLPITDPTAPTSPSDPAAATDDGTATSAPARPSREVVLHVHLSPDSDVARSDTRGRHLLTKEQIRLWCGADATRVTVKPVIDLTAHLHVSQYEVPDRLAEQVAERDVTCVFPYCSRTARACDTDHVVAYDHDWPDIGPTSSDNLAALCRHHHRHKTHHPGWTYTVLEPGVYLWHTPHGLTFLRDHRGTTEVTRGPRHGTGPHPPDA